MSEEPRPLSRAEAAALTALTVKKKRSESGQTIAEGEALVREALASPWLVHEVVVTPEWLQSRKLDSFATILSQRAVRLRTIDSDLFKKISELDTAPGILATVSPPTEIFDKGIAGITIALDRVSDPLNLGAIARTACFYGIQRIWLSEECVDILNPRAIRSSMGGLFHVPAIKFDSLETKLMEAKKQDAIVIAANALGGKPELPDTTGQPVVLLLGSEAHGIRKPLLRVADYHWHIRPLGRDLTLNVAATAAILLDRLTNLH